MQLVSVVFRGREGYGGLCRWLILILIISNFDVVLHEVEIVHRNEVEASLSIDVTVSCYGRQIATQVLSCINFDVLLKCESQSALECNQQGQRHVWQLSATPTAPPSIATLET